VKKPWQGFVCAATMAAGVASHACIRVPDVLLYNAAGIRLSVSPLEGNRCEVDVGRTCRFLYPQKMDVRDGAKEWSYDLPEWPFLAKPGPFLAADGLVGRLLTLRIDSDGTIWALAAGGKVTGAPPTTQPEGFPVRPRGAKGPASLGR
jgi:hypothetical protein